MPKEKAGSYRSYLLRCWQEERTTPQQPPAWRFVLQDVSDAQRQQAFGDFEQLVAFLRREILEEEERKEDG